MEKLRAYLQQAGAERNPPPTLPARGKRMGNSYQHYQITAPLDFLGSVQRDLQARLDKKAEEARAAAEREAEHRREIGYLNELADLLDVPDDPESRKSVGVLVEKVKALLVRLADLRLENKSPKRELAQKGRK